MEPCWGEADPYPAPKLLLLVPTPAILQALQAACSVAALSLWSVFPWKEF